LPATGLGATLPLAVLVLLGVVTLLHCRDRV
jgi:hypothetical protein